MDLKKSDKPSYSKLLQEIEAGNIEALILIPGRREVIVRYSDGTSFKAPTLRNDQQILRAAESSGTSLTVKDLREEQALASFV